MLICKELMEVIRVGLFGGQCQGSDWWERVGGFCINWSHAASSIYCGTDAKEFQKESQTNSVSKDSEVPDSDNLIRSRWTSLLN